MPFVSTRDSLDCSRRLCRCSKADDGRVRAVRPHILKRTDPTRSALQVPTLSLRSDRDFRGLEEGDNPLPCVLAREMVSLGAASKVELGAGPQPRRRHEVLH